MVERVKAVVHLPMEMSQQERQLLQLIADGCTREVISGELSLSLPTLDRKIERLKAKFSAVNIANLIYKASMSGILMTDFF